ISAYHEAGHAVTASLLPEADPVHKVTIVPRGQFAGATMSLPERDRMSWSKKYCEAFLTHLFGGRVAEEMCLPDISSGAYGDIRTATDLARRMITEWGMSEELGPMSYTAEEEHLFLGREVTRTRGHGDEIADRIDKETRRLIDQAYARARTLLEDNRFKLEAVARALLKYETLSGEEVHAILDGKDISELRPESPGGDDPPKEASPADGKEGARGKDKDWKPGQEPLPGPQQA
ncbi:MAG: ATP-dependent zinc metalloprotease FtsH, partial [Planctomycetota bacterium]